MELNGISNIFSAIQLREMGMMEEKEMIARIKKQVNLLNRYMVAYDKNPKIQWYEVCENPTNYPIQGTELK